MATEFILFIPNEGIEADQQIISDTSVTESKGHDDENRTEIEIQGDVKIEPKTTSEPEETPLLEVLDLKDPDKDKETKPKSLVPNNPPNPDVKTGDVINQTQDNNEIIANDSIDKLQGNTTPSESEHNEVGNDSLDKQGEDGTTDAITDETKSRNNLLQAQKSMLFELEDALRQLLDKIGIRNDVWILTDDTNHHRISFIVPAAECDVVFRRLGKFGIGRIAETSITLVAAPLHYQGKVSAQSQDKAVKTSDDPTENGGDTDSQEDEDEEFLKSIKSTITVAQVVEGVTANARLTFDYVMLIILASIIAGLGLAENSSVVLVASMLISPLMGPIMGGTFGIMISNHQLWKLGIKNEVIGLALCLLCGFLFGLVTAAVNSDGANWGSSDTWPTMEMKSRGLHRSLWVGILIALPSGAGVALSILGGNAGSLVGVAISASLLPPAVNAGMLWAYSFVTALHHPQMIPLPVPEINDTNSLLNPNASVLVTSSLSPPNCPHLVNNAYTFEYSCSMPREVFILGIFSFLLTLLNIFCIIMMGVLVLKIKEIAPHTALSMKTEAFWKKDIKVARKVYQTVKRSTDESNDLAKEARRLAEEWRKQNQPAVIDEEAPLVRKNYAKSVDDIFEKVQEDSHFQEIDIRSQGHTNPILRDSSRRSLRRRHKSSVSGDHDYTGISELFGQLPSPSSLASSPEENHQFTFSENRWKLYRKRRMLKADRQISTPNMYMDINTTTQGRFKVTSIKEEDEKSLGKSPSSATLKEQDTSKIPSLTNSVK